MEVRKGWGSGGRQISGWFERQEASLASPTGSMHCRILSQGLGVMGWLQGKEKVPSLFPAPPGKSVLMEYGL